VGQSTFWLWISRIAGPTARLLDLCKSPFCAFKRVAAKLGGKSGDRGLYGPLQEVQLLQPLEPALNVTALDQSFDRLDGPVLPTHSNEYGGVVASRFRKLDALVDERLKSWTGGTLC